MVANKCVNVRERAEVVERNKKGPHSSPGSSVSVKENADREYKEEARSSEVTLNGALRVTIRKFQKLLGIYLWGKVLSRTL